jgi:thiol-disulfide isomerase/thioredoxin
VPLNKNLLALVIIAPLFLTIGSVSLGASTTQVPLAKGEKLPLISLPIPKNPGEKSYLGLTGEGFFKINQIKADAVLIKIFNFYCPVCQATAAVMGELYNQIENNPQLRNKIKLIGIGVGNNLLEVEVFKQGHHLPFPVFPDEDFKIHQILGEVRTPFFIAAKMNGDGSADIVHTHPGGLADAKAFLDLMVEVYGIKQENLQLREVASSPNESRSDGKLK